MWKLANGGIIGTTKQPVMYKDFDRIEVSDNSSSYGNWETRGRPNWDNKNYNIKFTIRFYNPSTHTVAKSFHTPGVTIYLGPIRKTGTCGSRYSNNSPYMLNLVPGQSYYNRGSYSMTYLSKGSVTTFDIYPAIDIPNTHYAREWTPYKGSLSNYWNDTWTKQYEARLYIRTGGGKRYRIYTRKIYEITYIIRN